VHLVVVESHAEVMLRRGEANPCLP
jgi:hypothetical protein